MVKSGRYIAPKMGTMVITPYRAKAALGSASEVADAE